MDTQLTIDLIFGMQQTLCLICIIHLIYLIVNAESVHYSKNIGYGQLVICIFYTAMTHYREITSSATLLYESIYFATLIALNSEFYIEQFNETKRKLIGFAEFSKCATVTQNEREYVASQFIHQNPNGSLLNLSVRRIINTVRILSWLTIMLCMSLIVTIR